MIIVATTVTVAMYELSEAVKSLGVSANVKKAKNGLKFFTYRHLVMALKITYVFFIHSDGICTCSLRRSLYQRNVYSIGHSKSGII